MGDFSIFFFFQAEDGIRDSSVTGVQTCALPISNCMPDWLTQADREEAIYVLKQRLTPAQMREVVGRDIERLVARTEHVGGLYRSEEGRGGEEGRFRGAPDH